MPAEVENVIAGCVQQFGEQAFNIARNAWLQEGLPLETSATTIDLQCGSAQQAVGLAAALVASGIHDVVIGSGVEHMGHIPFGAGMETQQSYGGAFTPKLMEKYNIVGQGLGAEMIADQWEITRSRARRAGACARTARGARDRGGPVRARGRPVPGQRRHLRGRPGHPPRHEPRGAVAAQAGVQARRQDHGGQLVADLRRRRRGDAHDARRRLPSSASRRARASSTRRPSAATR